VKKLVFSLLLSFGIFISDSHAVLRAHYTFDNVITDSSGNGYNLNVAGGGVAAYEIGYDGTANGAYTFNGVDNDLLYIGLPSSPSGTIAFWMKDDATAGFQNFVNVQGGGETTLVYTSVAPEFSFSDALTVNTVNNSGVYDNTWHHIAVAFSGPNTGILYIDGVATALDIDLGENMGIGTTLQIGTNGGSRYTGAIDDLRIYNTPLSAPLVAALAVTPVVVPVPVSPKAYLVLALVLFFIGLKQTKKLV